MTVSNEVYRHDYAGNGSTVLFAIGFYFLIDAHIKAILYNSVTEVETELTLTTHYTLTGAGNVNGGELTMITAPTSDESLTILRNVDLKQEDNYVEGTSFPAEDHEMALDKLTMTIQQLKEEVERSLKSAKSQPGTWILQTPIANYFLRYNATTNVFETFNIADLSLYTVSAFAETLLDDLTAAAARDTLGTPPNDNILINQDFSIWQENTTFTNPADDDYTADGYYINKANGAGTASSVNVKKNTSVHEDAFGQSMELEITNVGSGGAGRIWEQRQKFEDYKKYRGKTLSLAVRYKASAAITLPGRIWIYDGVGSPSQSITSIGTDWVTTTIEISVDSGATQLFVSFSLCGGAATEISTTGSIYIQWMKLELSSVATPLIPRKTGEELALCQRYYQKSYAQGVFAGTTTLNGMEYFLIQNVNDADHVIHRSVRLPVIMKAAPTVTLYDAVGNSGRITMAAGDNIVGTVANIGDGSFDVYGTNGAAATERRIQYHYIAISRS